MKIASKTRKIEKVCTIASEAEMGYGSKMACRRLAETKKQSCSIDMGTESQAGGS